VIAALILMLLVSAELQATQTPAVDAPIIANVASPLLNQLAVFNPAPMLAKSMMPKVVGMPEADAGLADASVDAASPAGTRGGSVGDAAAALDDGQQSIGNLRKALITVAMKLRDIRYVRGGHDPSTGFDCSGFVRYVFAHAIGLHLPTNSASQFLAGLKVKRADMKPGDLVFFHTRGRHHISHVGIYISDGNFIHSPTTGKSVEISSLDESYWAKHFAGAKRPEGIAVASNNG
jgi:cell wall-associated NlpC family hydrolase